MDINEQLSGFTQVVSAIGITGLLRNQISKARCDSYEMIRFKTHLDELDVRRGLKWRQLYPDLSEHIEKNITTDDIIFQELKIMGMPTGDQEVKKAI